MPFWRNYVHIVWTTKERQPLIQRSIEPLLFAQMVKKAAEMGCYVYAIDGTEDHIHLVLAIPPKYGVSEVVKMLKGASSHFVNQVLRPTEFHFEWQRGYGCFSLGHSQLPRAVAYVESQKEHHAHQTANFWLERTSELEEGPDPEQVTDSVVPKGAKTLREETVGYNTLEDMPF